MNISKKLYLYTTRFYFRIATSPAFDSCSVDTVISGKVHVTVYDEKDTFVESLEPKHVAEIVNSVGQWGLFTIPDFVEVDGRTVCVTSSGHCEFIYGKEQHVTTAHE